MKISLLGDVIEQLYSFVCQTLTQKCFLKRGVNSFVPQLNRRGKYINTCRILSLTALNSLFDPSTPIQVRLSETFLVNHTVVAVIVSGLVRINPQLTGLWVEI